MPTGRIGFNRFRRLVNPSFSFWDNLRLSVMIDLNNHIKITMILLVISHYFLYDDNKLPAKELQKFSVVLGIKFTEVT